MAAAGPHLAHHGRTECRGDGGADPRRNPGTGEKAGTNVMGKYGFGMFWDVSVCFGCVLVEFLSFFRLSIGCLFWTR